MVGEQGDYQQLGMVKVDLNNAPPKSDDPEMAPPGSIIMWGVKYYPKVTFLVFAVGGLSIAFYRFDMIHEWPFSLLLDLTVDKTGLWPIVLVMIIAHRMYKMLATDRINVRLRPQTGAGLRAKAS